MTPLLLLLATPCFSFDSPPASAAVARPAFALSSARRIGLTHRVVHMSTNSNDNAAASLKRIFCYGDSLTAGTSPPSDELHPYGPHLERALNDDGGAAVMVRWRGLPGWTATAMAEYIDDGSIGLNPVLDGIRDPSLSLVMILAGTNDVGALTSSMMGGSGEDIDAASATDPILTLHKSCLERAIPTVAVGIPGSGWQEMNSDASRLCREMNQALQDFANGQDQVAYVDFPFPIRGAMQSGAGMDCTSPRRDTKR